MSADDIKASKDGVKSPTDLARVLAENARLRAENEALRASVRISPEDARDFAAWKKLRDEIRALPKSCSTKLKEGGE